jgi:hypothetical protein
MFEVICIKQGKWEADDGADSVGPKYGEVCTVIDVRKERYYVLKEYQFNPFDGARDAFLKKWFIPLSSIDETEMERNYKTEKV